MVEILEQPLIGCGVKKSWTIGSMTVLGEFLCLIVSGKSCRIHRPSRPGYLSKRDSITWPRPPPMSTIRTASSVCWKPCTILSSNGKKSNQSARPSRCPLIYEVKLWRCSGCLGSHSKRLPAVPNADWKAHFVGSTGFWYFVSSKSNCSACQLSHSGFMG